MSPVVVFYRTIVLLDTQRPSAYDIVGNGELVHQVKIHEHSEDNLESCAVTELSIIELVTVEIELLCGWDPLSCQPYSIVITGGGVVRQTVQCHALELKSLYFKTNNSSLVPWHGLCNNNCGSSLILNVCPDLPTTPKVMTCSGLPAWPSVCTHSRRFLCCGFQSRKKLQKLPLLKCHSHQNVDHLTERYFFNCFIHFQNYLIYKLSHPYHSTENKILRRPSIEIG